MKITRVQLPDGRLLTIEGGTAEGTANLLVNHYLKQSQAAEAALQVEDPLPVPGLSSESSPGIASHRCEPESATNSANEEPMVIPAMSFAKTDALVVSSASADEEPLAMPAMQF